MPAPPARADAVVVTKAMLASTIVEYFVEDDGVRVEMEITLADLAAFRNLLPDEIHRRLGLGDRPLSERIPDFFAGDLTIAPDDGAPVVGRILSMAPRPRTVRDEITGEPLPPEEGEENNAVHVVLHYPFASRPASLELGGSAGLRASVGFVVYHRGVAVNDFRYLGGKSYVLDLDWEDPWYSAFRSRNLRRAYFAPMSGFLYVDAFEVRKEIIARPKDLQRWLDLGLEGSSTIPVEAQPELLRKVAEFLRKRHPVKIDGKAVAPELARINFLRRTLRNSTVYDPPEELALESAMLGAIFVYPTDGLPKQVTMVWDLFDERVDRVPVSAVDQAGPFPGVLTIRDPVLTWTNFLKKPVLPEMKVTMLPPGRLAATALTARWPLVAGTAAALAWLGIVSLRRRRVSLAPLAAAVFLSAASVVSFPLGRPAELRSEEARQLMGGLLHNVYHAFHFRREAEVYDVLEKSLDGDLLTGVYLDTRNSLELRSQGGARVRVREVELSDLEGLAAENEGFSATVTWRVSGSVGHWGHVHTRSNRYRATLRVEPRDGAWKLTKIDKELEERL
jgi:hypothetical protein